MLLRPVDVPPTLRQAAERQNFTLGRSAKCETFELARAEDHYLDGDGAGKGVRVLLCTQPIIREGDRFALGAILGGDARQRRALLETFHSLVLASGLEFPQSRSFEYEDLTVLRASWTVHGKLRAVLAQAAATAITPARPQVELEPGADFTDASAAECGLESLPAPSSQPSSLPSGLSGDSAIDAVEFKQQLTRFALAYDGGVNQMLRRILAGVAPSRRTWAFELGCVVVESRSLQAVVWALEFPQIEMLERAHELLPRILDDRIQRGSRLRSTILDAGDGQTQFPALAVMAEGNTQAARVEMMGVLRTLLVSLDRLGIHGELAAS